MLSEEEYIELELEVAKCDQRCWSKLLERNVCHEDDGFDTCKFRVDSGRCKVAKEYFKRLGEG